MLTPDHETTRAPEWTSPPPNALLPVEAQSGPARVFFRIADDMMEPAFRAGDTVVVSLGDPVRFEGYYLVQIPGDPPKVRLLTFGVKRGHVLVTRPADSGPPWTARNLWREDAFDILGPVDYVCRRLR